MKPTPELELAQLRIAQRNGLEQLRRTVRDLDAIATKDIGSLAKLLRSTKPAHMERFAANVLAMVTYIRNEFRVAKLEQLVAESQFANQPTGESKKP